MAHALPAYPFTGYLYAAAVADDAAVSDTLILPTMAFPVFDRTENPLTKKAILFRLIRAVIDGLRLKNLTIRLVKDHLGAHHTKRDGPDILL
jgi:hypothetical protein